MVRERYERHRLTERIPSLSERHVAHLSEVNPYPGLVAWSTNDTCHDGSERNIGKYRLQLFPQEGNEGMRIRTYIVSLYALKLLRAHGMQEEELQEVFRSKVMSRFMYASQAWWGFAQNHRNSGMETTSHTINRIQAFINKSKRFEYCSQSCEPFITLCEQADDNLFKQIITNENHVLHHLIPKTKTPDHYSIT